MVEWILIKKLDFHENNMSYHRLLLKHAKSYLQKKTLLLISIARLLIGTVLPPLGLFRPRVNSKQASTREGLGDRVSSE